LLGQTQTRGDGGDIDLVGDGAGGDDFLSRERALLGDDADQFASSNDKLATVEDGDDDLLGGDSSFQANAGNEEMMGFESSFPAIDTTNDVCNMQLDDLGNADKHSTWLPVAPSLAPHFPTSPASRRRPLLPHGQTRPSPR
jgi:hypothetical protein